MNDIEFSPSNLLHKSAGTLAIILTRLEDDVRYKVELSIMEGDYITTFNILNDLKNLYVNGFRENLIPDEDKIEIYPLMLMLDNYINNLAVTHYTIRDLIHHKHENNFIYVQKILDKYGVDNAEGIAKEVYAELFVRNSQTKKQKKSLDLDDYFRDLDLIKQSKK